MSKLPTKIFSSHRGALIAQPNLVEIQTDSHNWFLKKGVKELFEEISPIKDYAGKNLELHFLDYYFDKPKYDEEYSKHKNLTYEAALRANLRLTIRIPEIPKRRRFISAIFR
ncbi:MAG: hypothetical protein AAB560_00915 [Patescibacteria group bacterium]